MSSDRLAALARFTLRHKKLVLTLWVATAAADYNLLLVSRLREDSSRYVRIGVLRTVASTGSVITSAGLIFAASIFGLALSSVT